jgi:hypothetical protein
MKSGLENRRLLGCGIVELGVRLESSYSSPIRGRFGLLDSKET